MTLPEAAPRPGERGSLYLEVVTALVLLGMVLVSIGSMFVTAAAENASSADLTASATLARDRAESLTATPYDQLIAGTSYEKVKARNQFFDRTTLIEADQPQPGMKRVTVTVAPQARSRYRPFRPVTVRLNRVP